MKVNSVCLLSKFSEFTHKFSEFTETGDIGIKATCGALFFLVTKVHADKDEEGA